jgi:hypothetical protein
MLHTIKNTDDKFINCINDDPVRGHIPIDSRLGVGRDVFVSTKDDQVTAVTCVSYQRSVPEDENQLFETVDTPDVVVFYTIWSYASGAGRQLIFDAVQHIQQHQPTVRRFVTLSPQTDMARRFHLKNGAVVFRENPTSVNYEYINL